MKLRNNKILPSTGTLPPITSTLPPMTTTTTSIQYNNNNNENNETIQLHITELPCILASSDKGIGDENNKYSKKGV